MGQICNSKQKVLRIIFHWLIWWAYRYKVCYWEPVKCPGIYPLRYSTISLQIHDLNIKLHVLLFSQARQGLRLRLGMTKTPFYPLHYSAFFQYFVQWNNPILYLKAMLSPFSFWKVLRNFHKATILLKIKGALLCNPKLCH